MLVTCSLVGLLFTDSWGKIGGELGSLFLEGFCASCSSSRLRRSKLTSWLYHRYCVTLASYFASVSPCNFIIIPLVCSDCRDCVLLIVYLAPYTTEI